MAEKYEESNGNGNVAAATTPEAAPVIVQATVVQPGVVQATVVGVSAPPAGGVGGPPVVGATPAGPYTGAPPATAPTSGTVVHGDMIEFSGIRIPKLSFLGFHQHGFCLTRIALFFAAATLMCIIAVGVGIWQYTNSGLIYHLVGAFVLPIFLGLSLFRLYRRYAMRSTY
eukprot:TRINITY_DN24074_c0_g1_i2.p1 TRINITY_DN24074_c0_g1~~TRINITY_DN24074_c0_g1_i2.p1  ORF type:complete len:170 (-),score=19.99 TRINITY_DN24074_c0_g1_i2:12-521(-)